ncbi:hypothetical protein [Nocardia sp. NPDC051981]|uniref:hypothetical protein n=1 Tax=Nocardia sp. NPDC051981 TaxID=3155417 RepID=UPI003444C618
MTSAAVLDSPINALVWLANTLGTVGVAVERGEIVIPGSMTAALPVRPRRQLPHRIRRPGDAGNPLRRRVNHTAAQQESPCP